MSTVIKVENLSKRYRLGVINRDMLYKDLQSRWAKFRGKEDPNATIGLKHDKRLEHGDEFWALRNVDLEVKEGEILGIIGRNGAGKSTLLKILSQITAPTEGRIKVKGRIASLLEVGTGFHPELTGRENVYLNGAILGMTRKEVTSKLDEIVAFADIDEFIDTPVKRYSSGMYVRLAFAVAAHLEPEILIVDEVLAVGDAEFQKKCLGRMEAVADSGKTVVLVSHNMSSIRALCSRATFLDSGKVSKTGSTSAVVETYISHFTAASDSLLSSRLFPDDSSKPAVIRRVALVDDSGSPSRVFGLNEKFWFEIEYEIKRPLRDCMIIFSVLRGGVPIFQSHDTDRNSELMHQRPLGVFCARIPIPSRMLVAGTYSIYPAISIGKSGEYGFDGHPDALTFEITEDKESEVVDVKSYSKYRGNIFIFEPKWETQVISNITNSNHRSFQ